MTHVIGFKVSSSSINMKLITAFGVTVGAMALAAMIITVIFVSIIIKLVSSRRVLRFDLERLKSKVTEAPAIYEELSNVVPHPSSDSPTISTGHNAAYAYASVSLPKYY